MRPSLYTFAVLVSLATNTYADDAQQTAKPRFIAERIGSLGNASWTLPQAINNRGQVVGYAELEPGHSVAFYWTRRDGFQRIVDDAHAWDINDRGDIVGDWAQCFEFDGERDCGRFFGFIWTKREGFKDLGSFHPSSINEHGDMAGFCDDLSLVPRACVMRSGVLSVVGEANTGASGINDRGDAAGGNGETQRAFLWRRDGIVIDLGPGVAGSINSRGAVAGWRNGPAGPIATLWTKLGTFSPTLSGASVINSINSRGDMVGGHEGGGALFWNAKTGLSFDLEGNPFTSATDISDSQIIVGWRNPTGPVFAEMALWHLQHGKRKARTGK